MSDLNKIKSKIKSIEPTRWWGDDFDVRFYLISRIKNLHDQLVLDIGGGIGIICSELHESNFVINLDYSQTDLKNCMKMMGPRINTICASMTHLPFRDRCFDLAICANLIEVAKKNDIEKNQVFDKNNCHRYPTVERTLIEISHILKLKGHLFLTTPNNKYYKTNKLTLDELNNSLKPVFKNFEVFFYNTHRKLGKNTKFNLANIIPKIFLKFKSHEEIINSLLKKKSTNSYSVAFFVEANN